MMRAGVLLAGVLACSPGATKLPAGEEREPEISVPVSGEAVVASGASPTVEAGCATAACWDGLAEGAETLGVVDVAASHRGQAFLIEPTSARLNSWIDALIAGGEFNKAREGLAAAKVVAERRKDAGLAGEVARRLAAVPASVVGTIVVGSLTDGIKAAYAAEAAGQLDAAAAGFNSHGVREPVHLAHAAEVQAKRGDMVAARRLWAAARAGFHERGAVVRIEPVEPYFTRTAAWHRDELALMRHWNPIHEHQRAYGVLQLGRPGATPRSLYFARSSEVVAFTEDGLGFLRDEEGVVVWQDLLTGALTRTAATPGGRVSALLTRGTGEEMLVLCSAERETTLWDARGRKVEAYGLEGTTPTITRVYTGEGSYHDNILRDEATWPVALAMTAGAKLVAIGGSDSKIRVFTRGQAKPRVLSFPWKYTERRHMGANPDLNEPMALAFDAKERLIAVYQHGDILLWDPRSGKALEQHAGRCTLAEATADVNRYNERGPRQRPTAEEQEGCGHARAGAVAPDGSMVVTGGGLSGFRVRTGGGKSVFYVADNALPDQYLGFADDGTLGLVNQNGAVAVWKAGDAAPRKVVPEHDTGPISVRMSDDGRALQFEVDRKELVWDLSTGRRYEVARGERLLAIDGDLKRAVVQLPDRVEVREVVSGKVVYRNNADASNSVKAVAGGGLFALDVYDGKGPGSLVLVAGDGTSTTQNIGEPPRAISDDGRWLATESSKSIQIRGLRMAGKLMRTLDQASKGFAFSRDGARVVWAAMADRSVPDVKIRVQAIEGSAEVHELAVKGWPEAVTFTPDGEEVLMMVESGKLTRWRWKTGETTTIAQVSIILANTPQVTKDGKVVLLPGYDHVQVRTNDKEMRRLATLYPLLDGGWVVVSGAGAVDGSDDAVRSMVTEVKGNGATLVFDGRLGWDAAHVPGTWMRALAGEDVVPPLLGRGPVIEEPLTR